MLQITGSQNPAKVERELLAVVQGRESKLQIPVHIKDWWLGGELGIIQLVTTWARVTDNPTFVTHILAEEPDSQLRSLSRRMFGFVSIMLASDIVAKDHAKTMLAANIVANDQARTLRLEAYEECRKVVEIMFRPVRDFALGPKVFLLCVDHSTKSAIPWLYSHKGDVRDRVDFVTLARELVERTSLATSTPIPPLLLNRFGLILHELFKNTHEHARTDQDGIPWRRSVRGIAVERHSWTLSDLSKVSIDNPALHEFIKAHHSRSDSERLRFYEFTVFDGGIGLARKWLGEKWTQPISLVEEFSACLDCLKHRRTSTNRGDKGLGLSEVMRTLASLRGFLKIRTGRLSLYRDFISSPRVDTDDVLLRDFPTCSETLTSLAPVYGTHYQILIPIDEANE